MIGGGSSGFVLHLSYWTVLISTRGSYILSIPLPIPQGAERGRMGGVNKRLHSSELPAGFKPLQLDAQKGL